MEQHRVKDGNNPDPRFFPEHNQILTDDFPEARSGFSKDQRKQTQKDQRKETDSRKAIAKQFRQRGSEGSQHYDGRQDQMGHNARAPLNQDRQKRDSCFARLGCQIKTSSNIAADARRQNKIEESPYEIQSHHRLKILMDAERPREVSPLDYGYELTKRKQNKPNEEVADLDL